MISDKRLFFSCTTLICTVLVYLTGLHSICHVPYATLLYLFFIYFFLQCPHLYICIVCMYIWLNCIYLYLNVYCQCLMLTVCTKGLRVTQFQFSVCMYCTCGRIDNKADLTWLDNMLIYYQCLKQLCCLFLLTFLFYWLWFWFIFYLNIKVYIYI